MPYLWRRLTPPQREELLRHRQLLRRPWHRPPHFQQGLIHYLFTAACYEHRPILGTNLARMAAFASCLLETLGVTPGTSVPAAWCVLPNHYHVLVRCSDPKPIVRSLGQLHGRTSFRWNTEDGTRGRKVWHGVSDRAMRNEEHFWATVNYLHHNPVKHGYVDTWQEWPFSSAADFLAELGRDEATSIWHRYPVDHYGEGWDDR